MIQGRVGRSHRNSLESGGKPARISCFARGSGESHFSDGNLTGSVVDLLGALAGSTRFIRLGSAGKALALQHPARASEDFAVLDLLSNGRAILGAGIGDSEAAFAAFGVPFGERRARFEEALDFIAQAWTSDAFSYGGRFTHFPRKTPGNAENPYTHEPYEKPFKLQWRRAGLEPKYLAVTPRPVQIPHPADLGRGGGRRGRGAGPQAWATPSCRRRRRAMRR